MQELDITYQLADTLQEEFHYLHKPMTPLSFNLVVKGRTHLLSGSSSGYGLMVCNDCVPVFHFIDILCCYTCNFHAII
jgi:hypothetical protein